MVVNTGSDPYAPFPPPINPEDGGQSSEDGSGIHSPVFGADHYPAHNDNFRYPHDHLDVQHSGMITPQYDYGQTMSAQQTPMLDTSLELPNSSARIPFSQHYSVQPRNQLSIDFHVHTPVTSRIPHGVPPMDFRYNPANERRLPGGPAHDQSYTRSTGHSSVIPGDGDHSPSIVPTGMRMETPPSPSTIATSSKPLRKETPNVVIACRQCRARKIRCDSTRPICNNCARRSNDCEYDEKPRRRGPDKRPGTRQRSCKKRPADGSAPPPKRKKPTTEEVPDNSEEASELKNAVASRPLNSRIDRYSPDFYHASLHSTHVPSSPGDLRMPDSNSHYKHELGAPSRRPSSYVYDQDADRNAIPAPHSLEPEQKAWWDRILRSHPLNVIFDEISFLVHNTAHLLSFINLDYIMKRLYSEERLHVQPAFVYAVLALAKLMRSSKLESGSVGLSHAMELANQAHASYKDAIELHWLDVTLVEAAFILSLFECSSHPQHSPERIRTSLINLDTLIRNLSLTSIDSHDRASCRFSPGRVPVVLTDTAPGSLTECSCTSPGSPNPRNHHQVSEGSPLSWDSSWSPRDITDEEVRRLCWSSLIIISDFINQSNTFNEECPRFFVTEADNYFLLFPGEAVDRLSLGHSVRNTMSPKESLWALYCRSMLLWNFCLRFQTMHEQGEMTDLAHDAISEAQAIENALNAHNCNLDPELLYSCRVYIHSTRILITKVFRTYGSPTNRTIPGPIFKRKQAQDWLFYGEQAFQRLSVLIHHLTGPGGDQLTRRPFRITWFINQLADCLELWNRDTTLDDALTLGKLIINVTDVVNELWPCPVVQQKCASLRQQLTEACSSRRLEGPVPEGFAVPPLLRAMRG